MENSVIVQDEYGIVSMGEMRMGWVATYKVFWQFDNFLLELVDISLFLVTLNDA